MQNMRAIARLGDKPDDIGLVHVQIPEPAEGQLRVKIHAIGVGIHDSYYLPEVMRYPYPLGIEAAGVIEAVGPEVTQYAVGEAIAFVSAMQAKGGTWAEFAVVDASSLIVRIPDGMSFTEAAALPVAGNTVLKAFHALALEPRQTLFIAGASGAIGTLAIQLAVAKGVTVIASASARNHAFMRSLGASEAVDYHDADWVAQVKALRPDGVDAALAIQPKTTADSMAVVRDGGRVVTVSNDQVEAERGISLEHIPHHIDVAEELSAMMALIVSQDMKLAIERVYPFAEGIAALEKTQTRRARGKLVIAVP